MNSENKQPNVNVSDESQIDFSDINYVADASDSATELKTERKYVSKVFWKIIFSNVCYYALSVLLVIPTLIIPFLYDSSVYEFVVGELGIIFMVFVFWHICRETPILKPTPTDKLDVFGLIRFFCIFIFLAYVGELISEFVIAIAESVIGTQIQNPIEVFISDMTFWQTILSVVILAPIVEEIFVRKILIGCLLRYGTGFAIVVSGLFFGFMHGNFHQFFYAAFMGIILGYVYCVYGKLRYTIIIHAANNLLSTIAPASIKDLSQIGSINLMSASAFNMIFNLLIAAFGMVFFVGFIRRYKAFLVDGVLISPYKTLWRNWGFSVYVICSVVSMFLALYMF